MTRHPHLGTPDHIAALAELDRAWKIGPHKPAVIPPETTRRLEALSAEMIAAGWPFPVAETAERLRAARLLKGA